jgi:hypothetical protein
VRSPLDPLDELSAQEVREAAVEMERPAVAGHPATPGARA